MKTRTAFSLVLLFVIQTVAPFAQANEKPKPRFSLTISEYLHDSRGPGTHRLRVVATNISDEKLHLEGCAALSGWYSFSVVYNHVPIEEKDPESRQPRQARMRRAPCSSSLSNGTIPRGESYIDILAIPGNFDLSRPGNYEITVSRETLPDNSAKSVTVKSNTITITVPDPALTELDSTAPQQ
jgi:hypothetical protein